MKFRNNVTANSNVPETNLQTIAIRGLSANKNVSSRRSNAAIAHEDFGDGKRSILIKIEKPFTDKRFSQTFAT
ncbi:hypothetical protein [Novipirellula rosea]|uniref:hypothetical protein n=1 Tax=Novipirellula rosea TaxID=1031540 RepID=UPI0031E6AE58